MPPSTQLPTHNPPKLPPFCVYHIRRTQFLLGTHSRRLCHTAAPKEGTPNLFGVGIWMYANLFPSVAKLIPSPSPFVCKRSPTPTQPLACIETTTRSSDRFIFQLPTLPSSPRRFSCSASSWPIQTTDATQGYSKAAPILAYTAQLPTHISLPQPPFVSKTRFALDMLSTRAGKPVSVFALQASDSIGIRLSYRTITLIDVGVALMAFIEGQINLVKEAATRFRDGDVTLPVQISCLEVAVRLEPGNPHGWSELGWAYRGLAMSTRSRDACERAVQAHRNSLKVDGLSNSDKGHMMYGLGTVLDNQHDYFGSPHDLEEAIMVLRSALDACPPGHQDYENCVNNLSVALHKTGSTSDRHESICLDRQVLELRPPGHPERDFTLDNLANSLSLTGSPDDLRESIPLYREALKLRPSGHPKRDTTLNNLALALSNTGSPDNLQESIRLYREALELQPPGHPDRHYSLGGLAIALEGTGSPDVFQESIQLKRETLELRPPGHPQRDDTLMWLAYLLSKTGSVGDLQESICHYREALELEPPGHQYRATTLNNLANALEKRGSPGNLEEAKRLWEEAQATQRSH
ncbi:hypothetical protein NMY22_g14428 [Coprinellus aureogranulatus]|nr:hypothetical protein NMY22_g14428 [Coprinellus aureogranulatus]